MSNRSDISKKLRDMDLFIDFTEPEIESLVDLADCVEIKAGENIVRQDESGDCMYVLVVGKAGVIHHEKNQNFELATLNSGDFFGELALVDEGPRSADVQAVEDCTLLKIPQSVISALAGVYPSAAFKLLIAVGRTMVARFRQGSQKYIDSLLVTSNEKK